MVFRKLVSSEQPDSHPYAGLPEEWVEAAKRPPVMPWEQYQDDHSTAVEDFLAGVFSRLPLDQWQHLGIYEILTALGATEIVDPRFPEIHGGGIISMREDWWPEVERQRQEFLDHRGDWRSLDALYGEKDAFEREHPGPAWMRVPGSVNLGPYDNIHPAFTGPGLYFHRGLIDEFPRPDRSWKMELFEIWLREFFVKKGLVNKSNYMNARYLTVDEPWMVVAELKFAALLSRAEVASVVSRCLRRICEFGHELAIQNIKSHPIYEKLENHVQQNPDEAEDIGVIMGIFEKVMGDSQRERARLTPGILWVFRGLVPLSMKLQGHRIPAQEFGQFAAPPFMGIYDQLDTLD